MSCLVLYELVHNKEAQGGGGSVPKDAGSGSSISPNDSDQLHLRR